MQKYCSVCNEELSIKAKFCTRCGAEQSEELIMSLKEESKLKQRKRIAFFIKNSFKTVLILAGVYLIYSIYTDLAPIRPEKAKNSVVMLETYNKDGDKIGQGSGFCMFDEDIIVTNFHVIDGAYKIIVNDNENDSYAIKKILVFDKVNDLALIQAKDELKMLKAGETRELEVSDQLTTISSPRGRFNEVEKAVLEDIDNEQLVISGNVDSGSSGGVLLNKNGRVVGVINAIEYDSAKIAFARNIELAENLYKQYLNKDFGIIESGTEIESFTPNVFDNLDGNELEINDVWRLNNITVYQPDTMDAFYSLTDDRTILLNTVKMFNADYPNLHLFGKSISSQNKIVDYYNYLKSYDHWWFGSDNIMRDETENKIKSSPLEWDEYQYILDMNVLSRFEFAYYMEFLDGFSNRDFDYILKYYDDGLPVEKERMTIVLMLFGDIGPSYFSKNENQNVINYLKSHLPPDLSDQEKQSIFERLGYLYRNGSVTW